MEVLTLFDYIWMRDETYKGDTPVFAAVNYDRYLWFKVLALEALRDTLIPN